MGVRPQPLRIAFGMAGLPVEQRALAAIHPFLGKGALEHDDVAGHDRLGCGGEA
jgi:hypothetical protein